MSHLLIDYKQVAPTTWVYLSSLLMIGLFFKFNRFWSVRHLDLILLILLAPGLLLVNDGLQMQSDAIANSVRLPANEPKPADGVKSHSVLPNAPPSSVGGVETESLGNGVKAPLLSEPNGTEKEAAS